MSVTNANQCNVYLSPTPFLEDEYGKDVCVRHKESTLLIFPQTMISKRIEDGEQVNIAELFYGLRQKRERIKN